MSFLKHEDFLELVLKEMRYQLPEKIILDSLRWVYNPELFKSEYLRLKRDVDKYFMHLSNPGISDLALHQLTVQMESLDATLELELISAKILLSLQELANIEKDFEIHVHEPEQGEWMAYFYHNQGELVKNLHGWKKEL